MNRQIEKDKEFMILLTRIVESKYREIGAKAKAIKELQEEKRKLEEEVKLIADKISLIRDEINKKSTETSN